MNHVILTGRPTKDPELRRTQKGTSVCTFSLAVDRHTKEKAADFPSCVAMGKLADIICKFVKKGTKIGVAGEIRTRTYEEDGIKHYITEVMLDSCEFLERKNQSVFEEPKPVPPDFAPLDDELLPLPF